MNKTLFFIADGNQKIGLGHISRCLMFAKEAKNQVKEIIFLSKILDPTVIEKLEKEGYKAIIIKETIDIFNVVSQYNNPYIIIDSDDINYRDTNFQKKLISNGIKFMHITVDNNAKFLSHYILNQNIIAESLSYDTANYTKKLLGPKYFILSEKARHIVPKSRLKKQENYTAFIAFGGADPLLLTEKILECLDSVYPKISRAYIIVGALNNRLNSIKELSSKLKTSTEVIYNTDKIYDYMQKCDIAFSAMGLTFWELTLHNIPCICSSGSKREEKVLEYIADKDYCISLGHGDQYNKQSWQMQLEDIFLHDKFLYLGNENLRQMVNQEGISLVIEKFLNEA